MVQQAFDRVCASEPKSVYDPPGITVSPQFAPKGMPPALPATNFFVVTGQNEAPTIRSQLSSVPAGNVLMEPERRNTLPAILWAVANMKKIMNMPDFCVGIITADHLIGNTPLFRSTLHAARLRATESPAVVTIGIKPSADPHEWIGFGAINVDGEHPLPPSAAPAPLDALLAKDPIAGLLPALPLRRFEEKPSERRAAEMVLQGASWYWNAGMFVFRVATLDRALAAHQPAMYAAYQACCEALARGDAHEAVAQFRCIPKSITHPLEPARTVDASIDYAVMVPLSTAPTSPVKGVVIPGLFPWLDIGSWDALRKVCSADARGNIIVGGNVDLGPAVRRCIVVAELCEPRNALSVQGPLEDHVVVLSKEGYLVLVPETAAQRVKDIKAQVDKAKAAQPPPMAALTESPGVQIASVDSALQPLPAQIAAFGVTAPCRLRILPLGPPTTPASAGPVRALVEVDSPK